MTLLAVLRHAKSNWDDPSLDDFDRPLNARGRQAALRVGRELKRRKLRFDQVIASPAVRIRETLELVAEGYGDDLAVRFAPDIYMASGDTLQAVVRQLPAGVKAPLLVGHNPGVHELVLRLTRADDEGLRGRVAAKFPTAAVALIDLPAARWADVEPASGTIVALILPRDLDD